MQSGRPLHSDSREAFPWQRFARRRRQPLLHQPRVRRGEARRRVKLWDAVCLEKGYLEDVVLRGDHSSLQDLLQVHSCAKHSAEGTLHFPRSLLKQGQRLTARLAVEGKSSSPVYQSIAGTFF